MKGKLIDLSLSLTRKQRITLEIDGDFRDQFDELKDTELEIEIKKFRKKRSLSANAYFHVLVNKLARRLGESEELVKRHLVIDYGALAKDDNGLTVGFKLPASVDVNTIYPYTKCFDERTENGKLFKCYLVYKSTHKMDTKEMAQLIDGAIDLCKEHGIETDTPEQIARFKESWQRKEKTHE